jgi:carbon storage regulator
LLRQLSSFKGTNKLAGKMLLLKREIDKIIVIDGDVKVTVLEISVSHVKIGIDAPKEVKVYREEIVERKQAEADSDKDAA